jgi:hypothetical protein
MSKIAVIFPLSFEPRSLGTYRALHSAIEHCSHWIKSNILQQLGEQNEVDVFVVANYEDWHAHLTTKNIIERTYNVKEFFIEPYESIVEELGADQNIKYYKQLIQPRNFVRGIESINNKHGEYDYYLKGRLDVFPPLGFDWNRMMTCVNNSGRAFDYPDDSHYAIVGETTVTGNMHTPMYMLDTWIFVDNSASQTILTSYPQWVEHTIYLLQHQLGYMMPETNYANLFYLNKIFLYQYHKLNGPLYRLYTYQRSEHLEPYFTDICKDSYLALTEAFENDYIDGERSIERQGGDSNTGFADKYN